MRRSSLGLLALAALGLTGACTPTCDATCRKLIACGTADGLNQLECEEACDRQAQLYEVEGDKAGADAFADHRQCLGRATCEEIEAGVCYDPDLFRF